MALPPLFLSGVALATLGLLLLIVGVATPSWATIAGIEIGIFQSCMQSQCGGIDDINDDLRAVQAMTIIGIITGCGGVGLSLFYVILTFLGKPTKKILILMSSSACMAAFVFTIIGTIIYGANVFHPVGSMYELGYSFGLCIVGAIQLGGAGALIFFGGKYLK